MRPHETFGRRYAWGQGQEGQIENSKERGGSKEKKIIMITHKSAGQPARRRRRKQA